MLHLVDHPLAHDALAALRDRSTPPSRFRPLAHRISVVLAAEALRALPTTMTVVESPLAEAAASRIAADIVVVPILRAGLGMLSGVLELVPEARVGHIGLERDERTAVAARYYAKLPSGLERSVTLLVDPMLATGGSAVAALGLLRAAGAVDLRLVCIVAAPEGVAAVEKAHPDVAIYTPVVDAQLDARRFIVPGLGDFGDRLYGTGD